MLREARKKSIKETIIRHAVELFKQKGYENVTVEEITSKCGIAKGTFFNYFPKKEHLLLHMADSYVPLMDRIVETHREGHVKERLLRMLQELIAIYSRHSDLLGLTLVETIKSAIRSDDASTNIRVLQETIRTVIEEAKQSGAIRSRWDSNVSASILTGLFLHTLIAYASNVDAAEMSEALRRQLDAAWEGIADE
ncbi:TetR/AcrR family transcriptional regulator [Paenibacillus sp. GYB003]|uniref:TetR/AcrR family transcriptional regulator n=1 Tax=Paenibacillus sp. GYB003 TaxID=2994392 RepID=UPI002F967DC9